jgi:hypothetical protein
MAVLPVVPLGAVAPMPIVTVIMTRVVPVSLAVILVVGGRSGVLVAWCDREMVRTARVLTQGSRWGKE